MGLSGSAKLHESGHTSQEWSFTVNLERERQRDGCFKDPIIASLNLAGQFLSTAQSKLLTVSK